MINDIFYLFTMNRKYPDFTSNVTYNTVSHALHVYVLPVTMLVFDVFRSTISGDILKDKPRGINGSAI
jgi:hypothetical protein